MLEKLELPRERILSSLSERYGLSVARLTLVRRGLDRDAATYRAHVGDGEVFFVKLRRGAFDVTTVDLLRFLAEQGVEGVIAPLTTIAGETWTSVDGCALVVFPFVESADGYEVHLSDGQWRVLGRVLRRIHDTTVPDALASRIRREAFSPRWREALVTHLEDINAGAPTDPLVAELKALMSARRGRILDVVQRAERLAHQLLSTSTGFVLCHADVHAGNVIVAADGSIYLVDWDEPVFAPRERDLMFIGAGYWGEARSPQEEQVLFYEGYGETEIDPVGIAYYRYERIVEDIAVFYERITSAREGREDRTQSLDYLRSSFAPDGAVDIAYASDGTGSAW
jgi:spectinomycin phosphotransferase